MKARFYAIQASTALLYVAALLFAPLGAAGQAHGGFKVDFKYFQLENGLRVVVSEDHSAPVVAVTVYYDVGSRNEVKGRSGFAHLFEHMMFQGSRNVGKAEHFKYIENNGGVLNASTHSDYTNYYQFLPSNQLELALWLEADRMRSLAITPANLKNQREAVKEEKRLRIDNQAYWPALVMMDEMLFKNWANAHPNIGSMKDLDRAAVADVRRFFQTYYRPNNAVLSVAGDVDPEVVEQTVRKHFGSIARGSAPPAVDVGEPLEVARTHAVANDPYAQLPGIALAWKIPPRRSRDHYPLELLNSVLLGGNSGRLYRRLVKEEAVCVEVQGFFEARRGPGAVTIFAVHRPDIGPERVQALIEQEIERIKSGGISSDELDKAKNRYLLNRFVGGEDGEYVSLQTPLGRAMALAEFTLFDEDPSLINTEIDRYLAVTADQISDAARAHLAKANRSTLYIRPGQPNSNRSR